MSPEEIQIFYNLGESLLSSIAGTTASTLLYGFFVLLFSISTSTFLRRGLSNRPTWVMFMTTVITFLIGTVYAATEIACFTVFVRAALMDNIDLPPNTNRMLSNMKLVKPSLAIEWIASLLPIINDIVVIWRAWVLFPERAWLMIVPIVFLIASIATILAYLVALSTPSGIIPSEEANYNYLYAASLALSMATNAVATLFVAYRLWTHRRFMINNRGPGGKQSSVQKVLFLIVESGFIYFIFQLVYFIVGFFPDGLSTIGYLTFTATYHSLSAMYPTIVVVLVNGQRSIADVCGLSLSNNKDHTPSAGSRPATAGHLSFALPPDRSVTGSLSMHSSRTAEHVNNGEGAVSEKVDPADKHATFLSLV